LTDEEREEWRLFSQYAREQMNIHLPENQLEWSGDAYSVVETLMTSRPEDFANQGYVEAQLERANLSAEEQAVVLAVAQKYHDVVYGSANETFSEDTTTETSDDSVSNVASATKLSVDRVENIVEPALSIEKAYERFQERLPVLEAALAELESNPDSPQDVLDAFFAILKANAVDIQLADGRVIKGFPCYIDESGVPKEDWSQWGKTDRISSGSLNEIRRVFNYQTVSEPGFTVRKAFSSYLPRAIEQTLDRLFSHNNAQ
jgi:hypothetical protein